MLSQLPAPNAKWAETPDSERFGASLCSCAGFAISANPLMGRGMYRRHLGIDLARELLLTT